MNYIICAVKDTMVGSFMQPFVQRNENEAIRSFKWDIETHWTKMANVRDLQLFKLAEYNDETGEINSKIEFLANAIDFCKENKEKKEENNE